MFRRLMSILGILIVVAGLTAGSITPAATAQDVSTVQQTVDALATGVSVASIGEYYTDATWTFLEICRPRSRCTIEGINDYSYIDPNSGGPINLIAYTAPTDRRGRVRPVSFRFPDWMYCGYYDTRGAYHFGWGNQLSVKRATSVFCGWIDSI